MLCEHHLFQLKYLPKFEISSFRYQIFWIFSPVPRGILKQILSNYSIKVADLPLTCVLLSDAETCGSKLFLAKLPTQP